MRPSKTRMRYPLWVRVTCCLTPLACVAGLCLAAVLGVSVPWSLAASVSALAGYVIKSVV
jgi:hypothetical protein